VFHKHLRAANSVRNPSFRKEDSGMHEGPCYDFTFANFENLKMQNLRPRYSDFYDDDIAARVARLYALEIERYGYLPTPPQQSVTTI
jgi:hypothetical protein